MTPDGFWELIDKHVCLDDDELDVEGLEDALAALPVAEIVSFDQIFTKSYSWKLWGAAYLIRGGCSDDSDLRLNPHLHVVFLDHRCRAETAHPAEFRPFPHDPGPPGRTSKREAAAYRPGIGSDVEHARDAPQSARVWRSDGQRTERSNHEWRPTGRSTITITLRGARVTVGPSTSVSERSRPASVILHHGG